MTSPELRIVTWNVGSLLEPGWPERRKEIVAWLDRLDPDVICLQEIWQSSAQPNTAGWIVEQLAGAERHWFFGGGGIDPALWDDDSLLFGSAVISRWPIDHRAHHRLPIDGDDPDLVPFVERVPWELVHARTAGVDVFTCHLASAPKFARHRRKQVVAVDEIIRNARGDLDDIAGFGRKNPNMPIVLTGDFNAEPDSDEIRFLRGHTTLDGRLASYQDAWVLAGEGPGFTQDWHVNEIAEEMNIFRKRIDYVFVGDSFQRAGAAGRVVRAELAADRPITGVQGSDHAAVVVDIVWPQRPE